ncbi:hypothetical protein HHL16_13235 [Pseudoflavitalea sp. G-6-1-2]|uniref:DUF6443 domain-containing protein n=1 Tax=Pseudoflavitalea sp. G-6-1-2 TaxID=2728841 RepID=UPI00146DD245|nr:DUF6443 domain-containing protein [Pseudoflavitalea sp. G-6-1-2]NML21848.1 hypothetical protein [Pseudoflavitalea sp. G-6-1-2]
MSLTACFTFAVSNAQTPEPLPVPYSATTKVNYVRSWSAKTPETDPSVFVTKGVKEVMQSTEYLDGLGRPIQTVVKKGAVVNGNQVDLVTPVVYDNFGRTPLQYLPFAATAVAGGGTLNDGNFKLNPFQQQATFAGAQYEGENYFYSKTEFEASPLSRQTKMMAPGNSWVGQSRGVESKYWLNTAIDDVKIWQVTEQPNGYASYQVTGVYPAGQLTKDITISEHQKQQIIFTDKSGQIILRKTQVGNTQDNGDGSGHTGWVNTYYVYDDFNNVRCVIQPEAVKAISTDWQLTNATILAEQCFRYEYDHRMRITAKQHPGRGTTYMIYDVADRLVFTQDEAMRQKGQWLTYLYDELNRQVIIGIINYSGSRAELQGLVDIQTATTEQGSGVVADKVMSTLTPSGTYYATNSISLEPGFESENNANINLELINGGGTGGSVEIEGVQVNRNPIPNGAGFIAHTITYYDNYQWTTPLPATLKTFSTTEVSSHFYAATNSSPYAQEVVASNNTKGMVTGSKTLVLGSNPLKYITSVHFYDEDARLVQLRTQNYTDGLDVSTSQYAWNGQSLVAIAQQQKLGTNPQTHMVITKPNYDDYGRVMSIKKSVSSTIGGVTISKPETEIITQEYNALGQLKTKSFPLVNESVVFDYNILGWVLGANRDYLKNDNSTHKFGYELGYDKPATSVAGTSFANPQFNGNASGTVWRSAGDGEKRKYDYSYDNLNRLTAAEFGQFKNGSIDQNSNLNFSVRNITYDFNGNILTMNKYGWKPGTAAGSPSVLIDELQYNYFAYTNKLKNVIDAKNDPLTKLGDFRSSQTYMSALGGAKTPGATDYSYDVNGNLNKDLNKDIGDAGTTGIIYNYLNLPVLITFKGAAGNKGTIEYTYDANGNKLKRILTEDGKAPKITEFLGNMAYEDDKLQYIGFEAGRIRLIQKTLEQGGTVNEYVYDYFLKDQLGNTRMVLTEQQETSKYYATMETAYREKEKALFSNITETAFPTANVPGGYPADAMTTNPNEFVAKLNGLGKKIGPSLVLRVMSGDKMDIGVKSFYRPQGTVGSPTSSVPQLLTSLAAGIVGKAGESKGALSLLENDVTSPLLGAVDLFRTSKNNAAPGAPKAFLNWILFDEQFNFVEASSNAKQVSTADVIESLTSGTVNIRKNGFLYVYVSNETDNYDVYFNDLSVVHNAGPILEETHYYPFGLSIAAISSKAFGRLENTRKFNGGTELNEGLGLHLYETPFRLYDPQLGRFIQLDEMAEKFVEWSPYTFAMNNPILLNDPTGLDTVLTTKTTNLAPVVVTAKVSNYKMYLNRLTHGGGTLVFRSTDSKSLRSQLTRVWEYENRRFEMTKAAQYGLLNVASSFVPIGKVFQGMAWAYRAAKVSQFLSKGGQLASRLINNPTVVKYGGKMLTEMGTNLAKETLANYLNPGAEVDYFDVLIGGLGAPFGIGGKIAGEALGATIDVQAEAGVTTVFDGSKRGDFVGIDALFGIAKIATGSLAESFKADSRIANGLDAMIDQAKNGVKAVQPKQDDKK